MANGTGTCLREDNIVPEEIKPSVNFEQHKGHDLADQREKARLDAARDDGPDRPEPPRTVSNSVNKFTATNASTHTRVVVKCSGALRVRAMYRYHIEVEMMASAKMLHDSQPHAYGL